MRFNNQSLAITVLYLKLNYHGLIKVRIYRQINKSISKFLNFQKSFLSKSLTQGSFSYTKQATPKVGRPPNIFGLSLRSSPKC